MEDSKSAKKCLSDFNLNKNEIGKGKFGIVYKAQESGTSNLYAMKVVTNETNCIRLEQNQISILEALHFHNCQYNFIIRLYHHFQEEKSMYLAFELAEHGNLHSFIVDRKFLQEETARFYSMQIILAVEYLHSSNISHRDIKPENVLVTATGYIKLADFGLAKVMSKKRTYSVCGTVEFRAPEIIKRKGYDKAVDWWAVGVLIYQMLCGKTPFKEKTESMTSKKIKLCNYKFTIEFSEQSKHVIKKFLKKNPSKRLGSSIVPNDCLTNVKWFVGNEEFSWKRICFQEEKIPEEVRKYLEKSQTESKN